MILLAMVWSTSMKYGLNVIDLRSEVPWEDKSIYVFYVDLATGAALPQPGVRAYTLGQG